MGVGVDTRRDRVTAEVSHVYFYSTSCFCEKESQLNRHVVLIYCISCSILTTKCSKRLSATTKHTKIQLIYFKLSIIFNIDYTRIYLNVLLYDSNRLDVADCEGKQPIRIFGAFLISAFCTSFPFFCHLSLKSYPPLHILYYTFLVIKLK